MKLFKADIIERNNGRAVRREEVIIKASSIEEAAERMDWMFRWDGYKDGSKRTYTDLEEIDDEHEMIDLFEIVKEYLNKWR